MELSCGRLLAGTFGALLAHAPGAAQAPSSAAPAMVPARITSAPTAQGEPNIAVMLPGADGRIIGTAELGGLEIYDLEGRRLSAAAAGEATGLDIRQGVAFGGAAMALAVSTDSTTNRLRIFTLDHGTLREVTARTIALGYAAENVCLYRSSHDGSTYAFVVGDGGEVEQFMLFAAADGRIDARQVRRLSLPSPVVHCVADDRTGDLYVAHETVGIWRFDANPEADVSPTLIDAAVIGRIDEEVGGLALYDGGQGARWLIASNASAGRLHVYDRGNGHRLIGAVAVQSPAGAPVEEPGGLYADSTALGAAFPHGGLLVADEGARAYHLVDAAAIASALGTPIGTPGGVAQPVAPPFPAVRARVETVAVPSSGDAADDPAIWVHPTDPARSLIIGTNKRAGLHLYDMQGRELQFVGDGKMNNVDLRDGFRLGGRDVTLVTASNRTTLGISIYMLDTAAQRLIDVADGVQASGLSDPYGLCMYRSRSGRTYVFVSDPDGLVRQWELQANPDGRVRLRQVRDLRFSSQTEGCIADDETGILYVGEEDVGLWRVSAEPRGPEGRTLIDSVERNPRIRDDIEGVGIYDLGGGRGYIVASSQGNDSYAVYRREGDSAYLGSFIVVADGTSGIDGISETDGLEVTSRNLGPGFEHGAMVAQDGRNVLPAETQNFKIVSWTDIAAALNLEVRR